MINKSVLLFLLTLFITACSTEEAETKQENQGSLNPVFSEQINAMEKVKQLEKELQSKMARDLKAIDEITQE